MMKSDAMIDDVQCPKCSHSELIFSCGLCGDAGRITRLELVKLADEGIRLRRELDERINKMRSLAATDLASRSD